MFAKRTNWDLTPNRLSEALAAHRAAGKPLLDLTVSNPTECGFSYDSKTILEALRNPAALSYEPNPRGLENARRVVARYYAQRKASEMRRVKAMGRARQVGLIGDEGCVEVAVEGSRAASFGTDGGVLTFRLS